MRVALVMTGMLLWVLAVCGGTEPDPHNSAPDVRLDVDWAAFLARHDLVWDWRWRLDTVVELRPRFSVLHGCHASGAAAGALPSASPSTACCVAAQSSDMTATLEACTTAQSQQWQLRADGTIATTAWREGEANTLANASDTLRCLAAGSPVQLVTCNSSDDAQRWGNFNGFFVNQAGGGKDCLAPTLAHPLCNGTLCPRSQLRPLPSGTVLQTTACGLGGELDQYFSSFSV